MRYGTIVKYFPDKSFGFIRPDAGPDVFFHISVLDAGETQPEVQLGQPVKYELMPRGEVPPSDRDSATDERPAGRSRSRLRAKLVELIDKLPGGTLADVDASQESTRHERARRKKPTWRR